MATAPYFQNGHWWIDIDPDDIKYVVGDVTKDLNDRNTTASSVVPVVNNVTVLEGPAIQGPLVVVKVQMATSDSSQTHSITFRVTCSNTERFDRTIFFNLVDH